MKILAVDSNSILNRAYYGVRPLTTRDGMFTHAIFGFMSILLKLLADISPDEVVFAFDLRAPTFRHKEFEGYKAQRKGMPAELAEQLEPLKELITLMGYPIVAVEGYEADDVLGTIARICGESGHQCVIATGDRDSFQLVQEGVTVHLAVTRGGQSFAEAIDVAVIGERYSLLPPQLIEVKALMGDSSDNIPGVAGVGEKTALSLIQEFATLDGVYENIDSPSIKAGVRKKLIDNKEMAYKSRFLAEIFSQVPIGKTLEELARRPQDDDGVYRLLERLELRSMISRLKLTAPAVTEEETLQKGEKSAEIAVKLNDITAVKALLMGENLYVTLLFEEGIPTAVALLGEYLSLCHDSSPDFQEILSLLQQNNNRLSLAHSKEWYRYGYKTDDNIQLVAFDPVLAGYVLSPLSSSYELEALCGGRAVKPLAFTELPDLSPSLTALLGEAALLPSLCEILRSELAQNNQEPLLFEIEQPLARVLASMEQLGFAVDSHGLKDYGKALDEDLSEITARVYLLAGGEFNLNSPKQLGEVLFERLGLPTKRKTKTGYSTDADVLDSLKHSHPIVEDILLYRTLAKLRSTYVEGLLAKVDSDGRVRSNFRQTETRTGRISSTEPNLQNIPVRTQRGSRLRRFFVAPQGMKLVDADYSQIELRVLAHIADDKTMQEAFLNDEDIHTKTAAQVFDMPEPFVTPQMRSAAKAVNFGIVYGIGAFSLSQDIGVTVAEADRYIKNYLATYSGVRSYMEETILFAKEHGYVQTMFGRRRPIPELAAQNHITRSFGERVAMNTPIQGTAADIIKVAMIRVFNRLKAEGLKAQLILQIHDELIVEAIAEEAEKAAAILTEEMQAAANLKVILKAESSIADNWLEAK